MATLAMGPGVMSLTSEVAQAKQSAPEKTKPGRPLKPKRYIVLFILADQERHQPELPGKGHWPGRDRLTRMGTTSHEMKDLAYDKSQQDLLLAMNDKLNRLIDSERVKDDGFHLPDRHP